MDINYKALFTLNMYKAKYALLHALEALDRMRYTEASDLQARYMLSVGTFEQTVLEAELDAVMAQRKVELIQICRNQRRVVNPEEIDKIIASERAEKLQAIELNEPDARPILSEEECRELGELFHNIVRDYHPAVHNDLSAFEAELYQKATNAYRNQDLRSLRLISGMLYGLENEILSDFFACVEYEPVLGNVSIAEDQKDSLEPNDIDFSDYSLAEKLYLCFRPEEDDWQLYSLISDYTKKEKEVLAEIEALRNSFPFTAEEILQNPAKMAEYTEQLKLRLAHAQIAVREQEERSRKLLEECHHG